MKRLLIALAAAAAVSTASAIITDTQLFETSFDDFVADVQAEDSSAITAYESGMQPSFNAPYPCGSYGDSYLKLDTGDATLWRTNTSEAANIYFDMAIQFMPTAAGDEPDPAGNKIVVFMDADTNIVVISGTDATDHTPVTNRIAGSSGTFTVVPKSWARLTLSAVQDSGVLCFAVRVNGSLLGNFYSLDTDTTVKEVGFSGSGALDDFVARTTDPFYSGDYAARIGGVPPACEMYATYGEALADALMTTSADTATAITLPNDTTIDGSAATPYAIKDAASLKALQDAVFANPAVRSLNFVQTANIDMTGTTDFYGIGWFTSTDKYASLPAGVTNKQDIAFAGTYDGAGYAISNVTLVRHNYAGVFNNVSGTVKDLTVQDIGFSGTCAEWGCAIVGNAQGSAVLENLTAQTSTGFNWGDSANHNVAGIVIRPVGATIVRGCVNNAAINATAKRLGGIAAFSSSASGEGVRILNCTNTAALTSTDGTRGVGGILGCAEAGTSATATVISGCTDFGSEVAEASGGHAGAIVGSNWNGSYTYTDGGGNTFLEATGDCGYVKNAVFGRAYAIDAGIDGANYLTTVAQADLAAGNTYVLLADVAASETPVFTFDAAGTIAFNTNGFNFAGTVAASDPLIDVTSATADGVITYTAAEGTEVATITKSGVTTSYSTLQKALAAAESGDTVSLVGAASGAVTIPAGITVQLGDRCSLADVTSLAGEGVLALPSGESPQSVHQRLCQQTTWAGTLYIRDVDIFSAINLTLLGNANSTVRFNNAGCAFTTGSTTAHAIKALEIGPNGLDVIGEYQSGTFTFPCALAGTGTLKIAVQNSSNGTDTKTINFTGDVSGFTGSITFDSDANALVNFGTDAGEGGATAAKQIGVKTDGVVTVAAGKTWTANDFIFNGNVTLDGALADLDGESGAVGVVWNNKPDAVLRVNNAEACVLGNVTNWRGTYIVGWSPTGAFNPNSYGNANSTVALAADLAASAYFGSGSKTTLDILPTVRLDADVEIKNGYSETNDVALVTFAKLTGDHEFATSVGTGNEGGVPKTRRYAITTLDNFTGSLKVKAGSELRIGTVNVATGTDLAGRVIAAECEAMATAAGAEADGVIAGALALTVDGTASGTLEYKADGAEGAGLYVASAPTPVTPEVTPSASSTVDCGSAAAATAAADAINAAKATYIKAPAAAELSSEAAAAYANLFDARADGNNVVVELNATGTNALETAAANVAAQIVAPANLASILSSAGVRSISVTGAQPGFFYSVVYAADLTALPTAAEGNRGLADAEGAVALPIPAPASGATAGFYRVLVNVQPLVLE